MIAFSNCQDACLAASASQWTVEKPMESQGNLLQVHTPPLPTSAGAPPPPPSTSNVAGELTATWRSVAAPAWTLPSCCAASWPAVRPRSLLPDGSPLQQPHLALNKSSHLVLTQIRATLHLHRSADMALAWGTAWQKHSPAVRVPSLRQPAV